MESSLRTVFNSLPRTGLIMRVRQVERSYPSTSSRRTVLMFTAPVLSFDLRSNLVVAVEISQAAWVIAAHVPGLGHVKTRRRIEPNSEALLDAVEHLKRRASIAPNTSWSLTRQATQVSGWHAFCSGMPSRCT